MTSTDETLMERVREVWRTACENGTADAVRAMTPVNFASTMIAKNDDGAACAGVINWRGIDFPDYEGLTFRIVAILPQVMRGCVDEGCPHHGTIHECVTRTLQ